MVCANCQAEVLDDSVYCSKCGTPAGSADSEGTRTMFVPATDLPAGTQVAGKYRIAGILGRGGMGVVYLADDTKLHRRVALKFLPIELMRNPEARERLMVEARAAAALSHPNLCTIHEIHDEEERPFIEMEYVEGTSLRKRINKQPLPFVEAVDIALQVAAALDHAHTKGVIHRDIKSTNIMVTSEGQVKVMDFGLAKVQGETMHTREGTTLGTAAYMSPEQARGDEVDGRTDIWSLGVVLYEMLSGSLPFAGDRNASILYNVIHENAKPLRDAAPTLPAELAEVVARAMKKDRSARYSSARDMARDLKQYSDSIRAAELGAPTAARALWRKVRQPAVAVPVIAVLVILAAGGAWLVHRQSKIRWARDEAIPEARRVAGSSELGLSNFSRAFALATEAGRYIPGDPQLVELLNWCSVEIAIKTTPPGATVSIKDYSAPENQWRSLGVSPIEKVRLPIGYFFWKFEKDGYETVLAAQPTFRINPGPGRGPKNFRGPNNIERTLDEKAKLHQGMVRVAGATTSAGALPDFFIDRHEVTNRQYKQFIDAGGYRDRKFWKHAFVKDGKPLEWDPAMAEFVDQTGRPGPSTWRAGDHPKGQEDYPVAGISWYEAAAYAEFAGKTLPTRFHWGLALGQGTPLFGFIPGGSIGWLWQLSNFRGDGPTQVASHKGLSAFGAYDMAGNLREWCSNEAQHGRVIRGGAWNDVPYMATNISQSPAFDRSAKNGFRCALYPDRAQVDEKAFAIFEPPPQRDLYKTPPVADPVFQAYREQFAYDKRELNAKTEWRRDTSPDWAHEKVTVDLPYGSERLPIHLFVPKRSSPPYQVVIYFPNSSAVGQTSSDDLERYFDFEAFLSFLLKNGRAVAFPVYRATFERRDQALAMIHSGSPTRQYSDFIIQLVKDFQITVDYLQARKDIDGQKLAFLGMSWGGKTAPLVLGVEQRLKAGVIVTGGMVSRGQRPEVDELNYVTRVKVPTLIMNGRYDLSFPPDTSVKPMFDLLGTPAADKRLLLYDSDHFVPVNDMIKETLAWLDRYLGPVR